MCTLFSGTAIFFPSARRNATWTDVESPAGFNQLTDVQPGWLIVEREGGGREGGIAARDEKSHIREVPFLAFFRYLAL